MASTVVVGQYAMTPEQMQAAGIIKPGSAPLIQALVDKGISLANAMPSTLFTGKQGAQNLEGFVNNVGAQADAVKTNLQNGKAALQNAGVITGKESPTQIAGLVKSAATVGVKDTISAVKGIATNVASGVISGKISGAVGGIGGKIAGAVGGAIAGQVAGTLTGGVGKALKAIGSGNLAGKFADEVTSGLSSLKNSLDGAAAAAGLKDALGAAQGIAAGTFNLIKNSLPKMKAGVPVNVAEVAKEAAAKAEEAAQTIPGKALDQLNAVTGAGSGLINGAKSLASNIQNQMSGGASALGKVASAAQGGAMADFQAAAGKVLNKGSGGASLLGTVSKIAGTAASLAPNAKGGAILGAVSSLAGSSGNIKSVLTNTVAGAVDGAISGAVNKVLDKVTGGVSTKILNAASVINSITGTKATGVASAFGSVSNAVSSIKGGIASTLVGGVSSLASGVTNLPGGAGAAAALINKSISSKLSGKVGGIAGKVLGAAAGELAGKLGSAALGGAAGKLSGKLGSVTGALDAVSGDIANKFSASLNQLKAPTLDAAAALAKSGLPAGLAAQLDAQIASIGSGGGSSLKMPAIALNTNNREGITSQTSALLGDPDIPPPNQLGEVSASTVSDYESAQNALLDKINAANAAGAEMLKAKEKSDKAFAAWKKASTTLPEGDPQIEALRQTALKLNEEATAKSDAFQKAKAETEAGSSLGRRLGGSSVTGIGATI